MLIRILLACGVLSSLLYVGIDSLAAIRYGAYHSYTSQAISELGAIGAPTKTLVHPLFLIYSVLLILFGLGVWASSHRQGALRAIGSLLVGIGAVGIMTPAMNVRGAGGISDDLPHIVLTGVLVLFILAAVSLGAGLYGRAWQRYSIATMVVLLITGTWTSFEATRLARGQPTPWLGFAERINIGAYLLWVGLLALSRLRAIGHVGGHLPRTVTAILGTMILLVSCRPSSPSAGSDQVSREDSARSQDRTPTMSTAEEPDTVPPADVSHGEAAIGGPQAEPAPVEAHLPPARTTRVHRIRLEMVHSPVTIAPGVRYAAWTFGGSVPGPALRVRQGDAVDFTLVNRANIPHSMDFHAAEIAPSKYYVNVLPGDSLHYRFVARVPGAFMYHCGTAPAAMHIANGMYGAIVVDPIRARPTAREFVFVQSEFYLAPKAGADGARSLAWERLLTLAPDHVVFNGRADQYASHPLEVQPEELLRLYVVNAGPNRISSFHVVGGVFERVFQDGSHTSPLAGVQTVNVPVGGGSIFELRLRQPGDYPFVTHAFADATKGAVGVLRALGPGEKPGSRGAGMRH